MASSANMVVGDIGLDTWVTRSSKVTFERFSKVPYVW